MPRSSLAVKLSYAEALVSDKLGMDALQAWQLGQLRLQSKHVDLRLPPSAAARALLRHHSSCTAPLIEGNTLQRKDEACLTMQQEHDTMAWKQPDPTRSVVPGIGSRRGELGSDVARAPVRWCTLLLRPNALRLPGCLTESA